MPAQWSKGWTLSTEPEVHGFDHLYGPGCALQKSHIMKKTVVQTFHVFNYTFNWN